MMIFRILACLAALALLPGCFPNEPGTTADVHTGTRGFHSQRVPAASGLLWNLNAQAIAVEKGGAFEYGIATNYTSTGLGWAFLDSAWSFGQKLPYAVSDRQVVSCSTYGCTQVETGTILLTEAQFRQFAKSGLEFKLAGKRGAVVGTLPPAAFQQVLALRAQG